MISNEHAWEHARPHVALGVVLWAFRWLLPEHTLANGVQVQVEVSSSHSCPTRHAIGAAMARVDQHCSVFDQPCRERMSRWQRVADAPFQTQSERAKQPSDRADSDLGSAVALAVVLLTVLVADLLHGVDGAPDGSQCAGNQR